MSRQNVDLGSGSVGKLLFSLAVPTITSQIVNMLYNLVDRVYIGHMQPVETVGKLALTGVGVCLPVIMVISAFAALVGMGGAPRASIEEGRGNISESERIMGNCFTLLIVISVVLTVFFQLFSEPLLLIFGASEATIGYAMDYMTIYLLGSIFVELSLGLNYFDTMRFIVIPQAIKAILPALGNEFIILLKDTSLITVIGGKELLHAAQGIMGRTYEAMFPLIGIACMYLVLVMIFTWLLGKLERRLRQSDRR